MPRPLVDATPLSAADRALLGRVKAAVTVEPGADVILYGSRARGDAHAESDWDLLVLVDGNVDLARQGRVTEALLDLELETAQVLVPSLYDREVWNTGLPRITPFHANVTHEGYPL